MAPIATLTAHLPRRRPARSTPTSRRRPLGLRRLMPIYLLLLPGMALYLLWALYPLVNSLLMSFFQWNSHQAERLCGDRQLCPSTR